MTILIVDEVQISGTAISRLLQQQPDMDVVAHVTTTGAVLDRDELPDVVLVSSSIPDDGARRLTLALMEQTLADTGEEPCVVVLGLDDNPDSIVPILEAGACGYVQRGDSIGELISKLRCAYSNTPQVSANIVRHMMRRLYQLSQLCADQLTDLNSEPDFTKRESQILGLVIEGKTNRAIAEALSISVGTVKNHVTSLLRKVNARDRVQLRTIFRLQPRAAEVLPD
ncbi:MAG: response regulator transcription factor [Bacteroidota bacterium]